MASPRRPPTDAEIRITQSHLAALGVAMAASAALSFLLGMQVGRLGGVSSEAGDVAHFTPDPLAQDELEHMLREVELARTPTAPGVDSVLSFPRALTGAASAGDGIAVDNAEEPTIDTESAPLPETRPPPPPMGTAEVPEQGWSIQVATTRELTSAQTRRDELIEAGWPAYVVASFVDGQSWYRVRVGGFENADDAEKARGKLSIALGFDELALTSAP